MNDHPDRTRPGASPDGNRRRNPRAAVAGVAVLRGGDQAPTVWRVTNLSAGGAGLLGDGALYPVALEVTLHVAGFPALELRARVLRRQLVTRAGRCAIEFVGVTEAQQRALRDMTSAAPAPPAVRRTALLVGLDDAKARPLAVELRGLGLDVRREALPGQAAAWLLREATELLIVDEKAIDADRWSLLQFAHDAAPEIRRFVVANDVRGFRLYYAIKAGLVEGLLEHPMAEGALAERLYAHAS